MRFVFKLGRIKKTKFNAKLQIVAIDLVNPCPKSLVVKSIQILLFKIPTLINSKGISTVD
jgi:hypothetical protein